jgi:putative tricarboxylic transport membrane protein
MARADFLTGVIFILVSLYVLFESWRMPRLEHLQVHPLSVPGIVPAFLAGVLMLFGGVLVLRSARAGGHHLRPSIQATRRLLLQPGNRRLVVTAILTVGYAGFLVGSIPYWLATGLFVCAFVVVFESHRGMSRRECVRLGLAAGILGVATSALVTWAFESLFLVTLP